MVGLTLAVGAAGVSLLALAGYGAVKFCANNKLFNRITACFKKYFCCCLPNSNIRLSGNQNQSPNEEDILPPNPQPFKLKKAPVNSKKPQPPNPPPRSPSVIPPQHFLSAADHSSVPPARRRVVKVAYLPSGGEPACDTNLLKKRITSDLAIKNIVVEDCSSNPTEADMGINFQTPCARPKGDSRRVFAPLENVKYGATVFCELHKDGTPDARSQFSYLDFSECGLSQSKKLFNIMFHGPNEIHSSNASQIEIRRLTDMVEQSIENIH